MLLISERDGLLHNWNYCFINVGEIMVRILFSIKKGLQWSWYGRLLMVMIAIFCSIRKFWISVSPDAPQPNIPIQDAKTAWNAIRVVFSIINICWKHFYIVTTLVDHGEKAKMIICLHKALGNLVITIRIFGNIFWQVTSGNTEHDQIICLEVVTISET